MDRGPLNLIFRSAQGAAAGIDETYGPHAAVLQPLTSAGSLDGEPGATGSAVQGRDGAAERRGFVAQTLFAWSDSVSPHLAVATEGAVRDMSISKSVRGRELITE